MSRWWSEAEPPEPTVATLRPGKGAGQTLVYRPSQGYESWTYITGGSASLHHRLISERTSGAKKHREYMPSTAEREAAAARQFYSVILQKLTNEKGVHAETAIAGAARMAGTFLMRSFNLPLDNIEPGTPVLSDIANEKGPLLVELLGISLEQLQVQCDPQKLETAPQGYAPLLDLLATQALLEPAMNQVRESHQFDYEQAARAATITTGLLIQQCQQIVDPHTSFKLAAYSFVEGSKTAPQRLPAAPATEAKKPWFKLW